MLPNFKPMLASSVKDITKLKFPLVASPKLDGIRCLVIDGTAYSRSLKPVRNRYIQNVLGNHALNGFDGEIIVSDTKFDNTHFSVDFSRTTSAVMSEESNDALNFTYVVFDNFGAPDSGYCDRYLDCAAFVSCNLPPKISTLCWAIIKDVDDLLKYETWCLGHGAEGVMLRSLFGKYKYGCSTVKGGELLKLKAFKDTEAEVVGFIELEHNMNEAETNELGRTSRSSSKDGKVPAGVLGALKVYCHTFKEFNIGSGFNAQQREYIWNNRNEYLGKLVKFKYQQCGTKSKPRLPIFLGFRDEDDL